jgi:hypothetical protein
MKCRILAHIYTTSATDQFANRTSHDKLPKEIKGLKFNLLELVTAGFVHLQVGLTVQPQGALCPAQRVGRHTVVGTDVESTETTDHQPHIHFVGRSVLTDRILGPAKRKNNKKGELFTDRIDH